MTPSVPSQSTPWWQTLLITLANASIGMLVDHFLKSPAAGVGTMAAGTAIAHAMRSPLDKR